jgi:BMFP domain-containing protein YqiC
MRGRTNFISDLAQMANGAASALGGLREEIDNIVKQRLERSLNARGLVTREEFDALRTRHEALAARLADMEARQSGSNNGPTPPTRKKTAKATSDSSSIKGKNPGKKTSKKASPKA